MGTILYHKTSRHHKWLENVDLSAQLWLTNSKSVKQSYKERTDGGLILLEHHKGCILKDSLLELVISWDFIMHKTPDNQIF